MVHLDARALRYEQWPEHGLVEKSRLEASLHQTQLEMLRMRLNPHFLFNTLQNASMLALRDPRTASEMLAKLGDLLRVAYRRDYQAEIALATEIELTRTYLEIERIRFGIRSARDDGRLVLTVTDNGIGLPGAGLADLKLGVGLGSVAERLACMYPDAHELELNRGPHGGTQVRASLPFRVEAHA